MACRVADGRWSFTGVFKAALISARLLGRGPKPAASMRYVCRRATHFVQTVAALARNSRRLAAFTDRIVNIRAGSCFARRHLHVTI
jgi:hypothetical protein